MNTINQPIGKKKYIEKTDTSVLDEFVFLFHVNLDRPSKNPSYNSIWLERGRSPPFQHSWWNGARCHDETNS